jgi:hypothetical protein
VFTEGKDKRDVSNASQWVELPEPDPRHNCLLMVLVREAKFA